MGEKTSTIRFKDLVSETKHFYLMHLSYGCNCRRSELWTFARQNKKIGLDHERVNGDWPSVKDRVKDKLRNPWPLQFDMLCENMCPKSMANGDVVVVMSGTDYVLGVARVTGPHEYVPLYREKSVFFDHVRPVEWIVDYSYEKRLKVPRVHGFDNTLGYVVKKKDQYSRWQEFAKLVLPNVQPLGTTQTESTWVIKKKGERAVLERLIDGKMNWHIRNYHLTTGGIRKPPNIDAIGRGSRFVVYFVEGRRKVFCASGFLSSKSLIGDGYQLTFVNHEGELGFDRFSTDISYDAVRERIAWSPVQGNIQSLRSEDYQTLIVGLLDSSHLLFCSALSESSDKATSGGTGGTIPTIENIAQSSRRAMEEVIRFEEAQGRKCTDVSDKIIGYDIESIGLTRDVRYIEVKSRKGTIPLALTNNEYETAKRLASVYYLYVVTADEIIPIKDPISSCTFDEVNVVHWRISNWENRNSTRYPFSMR